jgi:parallel beta-helix repeat protein
MERGAVLLFTVALVAMAVGIAEMPTHTATPFTVNSTVDPGTGGCDITECTQRESIDAANSAAGADTIDFNIPDADTGCNAGMCTINPSSELPPITAPVTIDGYSQPGANANTLAVGNNAVLKIELSGASIPAASVPSGLNIEAADSTVRGLIISNWDNGIFLTIDAMNVGAKGNKVQGNYIGTDVTGTVTDPDGIPNNGDELGNLRNGVSIETGAANNTIGGKTAAAGNIISGNGNSSSDPSLNTLSGVEVQFVNSDALNKAAGNRILSNSIYDNARLGIDLYYTNNPRGHRQRRCPPWIPTTAPTTCRTSPSSPPPGSQPGE